MDIAAPALASEKAKQPAGLAILFLAEMAECFSYYGVRSLFVLFLIEPAANGGFGWNTPDAVQLYGLFTGLVFITPIVGGYVADRYLGPHRAILLGGSIAALGYFLFVTGTIFGFYCAMALVVLGTGLLKPNVAAQVGRLYEQNDHRRDGGFTIFYMGLNLGALLGPFICGYLALSPDYGWNYGFGAAAMGVTLGFVLYLACCKKFFPHTEHAVIFGQAGRNGEAPLSPEERRRIGILVAMTIFVVFFWLAFEQTGSSMTVFAERNTDRAVPVWLQELVGTTVFPTAWFQMINPAMILIFAPLLSLLWQCMGKRSREPDPLTKMALGLFFLGAGFLLLVAGVLRTETSALASPMWLAAAYLLHAWAELCFSPVGLALVSRIAPAKFVSMMMAITFLCYGIANVLAGLLASTMEEVQAGHYFHVFGGQADFFLIFVVTSWSAGILLWFLAVTTRRLMT
jgi:POT family proton-dependent oligopeptide transporter